MLQFYVSIIFQLLNIIFIYEILVIYSSSAQAIRVVDELGHEVHDRYYKIDSIIELTCEVAVTFLTTLPNVIYGNHPFSIFPRTTTTKSPPTGPTDAPWDNKYDYYHQNIIWRLNNKTIPNVDESNFNLSSTPDWRTSRLTILRADRTHSGIYSCSLLNITSTLVHVQILNGEMPAAVQHNHAACCNTYFKLFSIILLSIFVNISQKS